MLEATVALQLAIGEHVEAVLVAALLLFNVALGVFQESRATAALDLLKQRLAPKARVRRDGKWADMPAADLRTRTAVNSATSLVVDPVTTNMLQQPAGVVSFVTLASLLASCKPHDQENSRRPRRYKSAREVTEPSRLGRMAPSLLATLRPAARRHSAPKPLGRRNDSSGSHEAARRTPCDDPPARPRSW
jgi:hypothetical protein